MEAVKRKRRTLLPWMGGKSKSADFIIGRFPAHTTYVEPFCGGCAVFFRKERAKAEILNDTDGRLVTLLRVLRYHPDELLREVSFLTHSRQEFRDALSQPGVTDIQRAARFLMVVKAAFGADVSGTPTFGYGKTARAKFNMEDVTRLVDSARQRLDGVIIENLDFADVIARYDSWDTLFYCDPPYIGTAGYACRFSKDDHIRLRDALGKIQGMAAISLNDCTSARLLYNGWRIEEVSVRYSVCKREQDRDRQNGELLILKDVEFPSVINM